MPYKPPPVVRQMNLPPPPADPKAKSDAAVAALLAFINAPNHTARSALVYEKEHAREHLETYYEKRRHLLPAKVLNPAVSAVNLNDREILLVTFLDENGRQWSAPFEWDRNAFLLHWEAMTGFGEISWQEFLENKPQGEFTMRATFYVPPDDLDQSHDQDYITVLMSHPDLEKPTSVLIGRNSEVHHQISFYPKGKDIPAIVKIKWADRGNSQPELTKWYQTNWIR